MKQKTLREDGRSREAETCRKRLRETPECAKAHSLHLFEREKEIQKNTGFFHEVENGNSVLTDENL